MMSADNTVLIRLHPSGGYTLTMYFGNEPKDLPVLKVGDNAIRYDTLRQAWEAAWEMEPEYGVHLSKKVWFAEQDRIIEEYKREQREVRKVMRLVNKSKQRHPSNGG